MVGTCCTVTHVLLAFDASNGNPLHVLMHVNEMYIVCMWCLKLLLQDRHTYQSEKVRSGALYYCTSADAWSTGL